MFIRSSLITHRSSLLFAVCCLLCASVAAMSSLPPSSGARGANRHAPAARAIHPRNASSEKPQLDGGFDAGEFLIDTSITTVPPSWWHGFPGIASDGRNFLTVWVYQQGGVSSIYGTRVTPQGCVLDSSGIIISDVGTDDAWPEAAFDGNDFLVVWSDDRGGDWDLYGARITPQGTILDPSGIAIARNVGSVLDKSIAFNGSEFLVVWMSFSSSHKILGARVTPGGDVVDTVPIAISNAAVDDWFPAAASVGTDFLVAWEDHRNTTRDIYAARVTSQGSLLDTNGIPISQAAGHQVIPGVTSDGHNYLVVWQDWRTGTAATFGARVTPGGVVLDTAGIAISTTPSLHFAPKAGFDGKSFLVAWEDTELASMIRGARVSPGGAVLDSSGFLVCQAPGRRNSPVVACDSSVSLVVWEDYRWNWSDVYGSRVSPDGVVLDPRGILVSSQITNAQMTPTVAFDTSMYLAAWKDGRNDSGDIYAARVTTGGLTLDPGGVALDAAKGDQKLPAAASNGQGFLVAWEDHRNGNADIYAARVSPAGGVPDSGGFAVSSAAGDQKSPAIASGDSDYLVVWPDWRNADCDIYGARVTPNGSVLDANGIPIARASGNQACPAVAADSAGFLVVWEDDRKGTASARIYGARVTAQGQVLDTSGIVVSDTSKGSWTPATVSNGADFLVVWVEGTTGDSSDICCSRVSGQGSALDSGGFLISSAEGRPSSVGVTFDGANDFVTWASRNGSDTQDIYAARVSPDGVVLDCGPIVVQQGWQGFPAVCHGSGSQLFLAYQGWTGTVDGKAYNTYRAWGKLMPSPGIATAPQTKALTTCSAPTIISGMLYLLAASSPKLQASSCLLDISGRKIMKLYPGANDVSHLAPGVYFVREEPSAVRRPPSAIRKVIITR